MRCCSTPSTPPTRGAWPSASRSSCCRTRSSDRSPASSSTGGAANGCCCSPTSSRAAIVVLAALLLLWQGPVSPAFYVGSAGGDQRQPVLPLRTVRRAAAHGLTAAAGAWPTRCRRPPGRWRPSSAPGGAAVAQALGSGDPANAALAVAAAVVYLLSSVVVSGFGVRALGPDLDEVIARPPLRQELGVAGRGFVAGARHVWSRTRSQRTAGHRRAPVVLRHHTIATILLYRNYFTDDGVWKAGLAGLTEVFSASAIGVLLAAAITPTVTGRISKQAWIASCLAVPQWSRSRSARRSGKPCSSSPPDTRFRRPGLQDLRRHHRPGEHRRGLPRPGVLGVRHLVQPDLRRRRSDQRDRPADDGQVLPAIVAITAGYAVTAAVYWSATVRQRRRAGTVSGRCRTWPR